jgi:hypothetical protein
MEFGMVALLSQINLTHGKIAIVDTKFYKQLMALGPWYYGHRGYAVKSIHLADGTTQTLRMHREVLKLAKIPLQRCTDHINHNKLDNRLANLRTCTYSQNNANKTVKGPKYKGVTWNKRDKKFQARIRQKSLGYFNTAKEAALAYNKAALLEFGKFASTNTL